VFSRSLVAPPVSVFRDHVVASFHGGTPPSLGFFCPERAFLPCPPRILRADHSDPNELRQFWQEAFPWSQGGGFFSRERARAVLGLHSDISSLHSTDRSAADFPFPFWGSCVCPLVYTSVVTFVFSALVCVIIIATLHRGGRRRPGRPRPRHRCLGPRRVSVLADVEARRCRSGDGDLVPLRRPRGGGAPLRLSASLRQVARLSVHRNVPDVRGV